MKYIDKTQNLNFIIFFVRDIQKLIYMYNFYIIKILSNKINKGGKLFSCWAINIIGT